MKTFTGTVENGAVKLPARSGVRDGSRVVLAVIGEGQPGPVDEVAAELEAEDVEFVRACRGRIVSHMRDEEC